MKRYLAVLLMTLLTSSCLDILEKVSTLDIKDIQKRKKLIAITAFSANSYFLYKGGPMGFEYDLLQMLARELNVKLEVKVARDLDSVIHMLNSGKGDIIAAHLAVTKGRRAQFQFTDHLMSTRQVLVQNRQNKKILTNVIDLIGKPVHVRKGSHYYQRLLNLSEEIGGDIDIKTVPGELITEKLIKQVADKKISYTIADENMALINKAYFPQLHVSTMVSFPQRIAWVVRKNSPELLNTVNKWIQKIKKNGALKAVFNRYYKAQRVSPILASQYHSVTGGKISRFDNLIKTGARSLEWDWRLLASLTYQESRFTPSARSWAGARGLMQVMPYTGVGYNLYDPRQNVEAGTKYLRYLITKWQPIIDDEGERLKFILASYNAGPGHIEDARRLARKYGKNPDVWYNNVEIFVKNLSDPKYYNDPLVKYGYLRGDEPYFYVRDILERFEQYKKHIEADNRPAQAKKL